MVSILEEKKCIGKNLTWSYSANGGYLSLMILVTFSPSLHVPNTPHCIRQHGHPRHPLGWVSRKMYFQVTDHIGMLHVVK